jgi:hypothetical protein
MAPPTIILQHSIIGRDLLANFEFDNEKPFRACLICGAIYQTELDRAPHTAQDVIDAFQGRQKWASKHGRLHSDEEHAKLKRSGNFCTPEAAYKLAPLGIAPIADIVLSDEHAHAARIAPRAPIDDAEDH